MARPGRVVGLMDAVDRRPAAPALGPLTGRVGEGGGAAVGVAVAGGPQAVAGVDEGPDPPGALVRRGGFGGGVVVVDLGYRGRRGETGPVGVDGTQGGGGQGALDEGGQAGAVDPGGRGGRHPLRPGSASFRLTPTLASPTF